MLGVFYAGIPGCYKDFIDFHVWRKRASVKRLVGSHHFDLIQIQGCSGPTYTEEVEKVNQEMA